MRPSHAKGAVVLAYAFGAAAQTVTVYFSSCPENATATPAPTAAPALGVGVYITNNIFVYQEECGCKDVYTDKTTTLTETCTSGQPSREAGAVPPGFTVTTTTCNTCAETPVTATGTCPEAAPTPAPENKAPGAGPASAAPAAPGGAPASGSPNGAPAAPGSGSAPGGGAPGGGAPAVAGSGPGSSPAGGAPAAAGEGSSPAGGASPAAGGEAPPYPKPAGSEARGAAAPSASAGGAPVTPFTGAASHLASTAVSIILIFVGMAYFALQ